VIVDYISQHRDEFGVEPICRVLTEHGCPIAPSTYYDNLDREPSKRDLRDAEILGLIESVRATRFGDRLGARKMWLRLRSQGHEVARCTIERLMATQEWVGTLRRQRVRTTIPGAADERPHDLVDRDFTATRPNQLWVADFTYVPTWAGMVYVAFIFDVYSRMIVGWRAATSMKTSLVLDCLEMALWSRQRDGISSLDGLIHHTDAGSQYTSFAFTQRLIDIGVDPSVGSVGDAYDNALAESQIGLYKAELIWVDGPWQDCDHVERETLEWVHWFNTDRTHEGIDDLTPLQAEQAHYAARNRLAETG
jgi:putative transposase